MLTATANSVPDVQRPLDRSNMAGLGEDGFAIENEIAKLPKGHGATVDETARTSFQFHRSILLAIK